VDDVPASIERCLSAVEAIRSPALRAHEDIVGSLSAVLGTLVGLDGGQTSLLRYAACLHDIGKIAMPDAIINKPAPLDAAEWAIVRQHTTLGHSVLEGSADAAVRLAATVALWHHESWDGSGYPHGLAGAAIPREARIVGVCDVYHALREVRPYKQALEHDQALRIILEGDAEGRTRPTQFDPRLLAALKRHDDAIREHYEAARTEAFKRFPIG
jgi:putative two-component system response regulator